jgi:two-component sensor histidine kinase
VRTLAIPVRCRGQVVAVLTRESAPSFGRQPGELERTYVDIFNRFARMIVAGDFPFDAQDIETEEAPRVGDGVILLDASMRVEYTSPNGVSALHRIGSHGNAEGLRFGELGLDDSMIRTAFSISAPVTEEFERGPEVTVLISCIPLIDHGSVTGAVVLTRDISELRRRDRLLMSKDATIREIHHRVKNNLQTVAALLRIQARRMTVPEARAALEEATRRVGSIALVHETLSHSLEEAVEFDEVASGLAQALADVFSADGSVEVAQEGSFGTMPAEAATALAMVLTELLQNAAEHAFDGGAGRVVVRAQRHEGHLVVEVCDDGAGLPEGHPRDGASLGLSIVRTLVETELRGTFSLARNEPRGTVARVEADLPA